MKFFEEFIYKILGKRSKRFLVLLLTFLAFVGSIMMLPTKIVKAKMLPGKSANTFSVYIDAPTGSSIEETQAISECVVNILKNEKEITDMEVFLGQGAPLDYAGLVKGSSFKMTENVAEIVVNLTDKHHREEKSYDMVHRLRPIIQSKCEPLKKGTSIKLIEQPAGPPTLASIVVELYGKDIEKSRHLADRIAKILKNTEGLVDIDIMEDEYFTRYKLKVNKDKLLKSALSIKQINNILYLAFEGMVVAAKNSEDSPDQIPIFLVLSDETKRLEHFSKKDLISKLSSLRLMNQKGMLVPVSEVVEVIETKNSPTIMHKDLRRMINIIAETDKVSQVYPLLEARDTMLKELSDEYKVEKVPGMSTYMFDLTATDKKTGEKYLIRWDGEMKVTLDTFRDLGGAFIAALILIFLLMVVYYKSFTLSGIVLLGSFLSIIGVIVGHWLMDVFTKDTFFLTATSLIGFISLMGISSRNSLLLIDFAKALMEKKGFDKQRAIAVASATRAKPIFLTAAAIILASTLLATDPIFGGLGVALIFGTVAAVIVSLIFVPVLMYNAKAMDFTHQEEK